MDGMLTVGMLRGKRDFFISSGVFKDIRPLDARGQFLARVQEMQV